MAKALVLGALFTTNAFGQAPNPNEVYVENINVNGTGCPEGSVTTDISEDAKAFTLLFSEFMAQTYDGALPSEKRKNCQITLNLKIPQGWQYSVLDVQYQGYVNLDRGVRGFQTSTYYFQGDARRRATARSNFRGPIARDFLLSDKVGFSSVVWSKCGVNRALNINASVGVSNTRPTQNGLITIDSVDGEIKQKYALRWKRCS